MRWLSTALTFGGLAFTCTLLAASCSSSSGDGPQDAAIEAAPCDPTLGKCQVDQACVRDVDCVTLNCASGACAIATCDDKKQDQNEQGIDCGGVCKACDGAKCALDTDCLSGTCTNGACGPSKGKTCGVGLPNACQIGDPCGQDIDCASAYCNTGTCSAPPADVHSDGRKNAGETDVDCGGTTGAPVCKQGQTCLVDADCEGKCTGGKCAAPTHTDGKVSPGIGETDIDCGGNVTDVNGVAPTPCRSGKACLVGTDCDSRFCTGNLCEPRKLGRQDGDESDVDCGGTADPDTGVPAPRCPEEKKCNGDADCGSTFCQVSTKICVASVSCRGTVGNSTSGLVTCGSRETGDPTAVHENCCHSLPLPTHTTVRLDKYEVTAGRMRQFVESVGPNLRAWAKNEIAMNTAIGQRLANDMPPVTIGGVTTTEVDLLPASATPGEALNLVMQLGGTVMDSRVPSMSQGCYNDFDDTKKDGAGNYNTGAFGANTYWWPATTLQAHFSPQFPAGTPTQPHHARKFTKDQYDEKPVNCGAYWMYAAFCAWDGGRLPTPAEAYEAWGAANYPWGTSTFTFPLDTGHQGTYGYEATAGYGNSFPGGPFLLFYHYPDYGDAWEMAGYIAAPGRYILDKTATTSGNGESWMDQGANVMETTRYTTGGVQASWQTFCDFNVSPGDTTNLGTCNDGGTAGVIRATGMPPSIWVGGSWEGHRKFSNNPGSEPFFLKNSYELPTQTQYGKLGVRCAR